MLQRGQIVGVVCKSESANLRNAEVYVLNSTHMAAVWIGAAAGRGCAAGWGACPRALEPGAGCRR